MKKSNRISCILIAALMLCSIFVLAACGNTPGSSIGAPSIFMGEYYEWPTFFEGVTIEGLRQSFEQNERFQKKKIENDVDFMRYKDQETKAVVTVSLDPPADHVNSFSFEFKVLALTEKNKPGHLALIKEVLALANIEIDDDTAAKVLSGSYYDDDLYVYNQTIEGKYIVYVNPGSAKSYFEPDPPDLSSGSSASQ